jgi:hypothetical protein
MPDDSSTSYGWVPNSGAQRFCAEPCHFYCNVDLPSGAKIAGLEIDGCDTSESEYIHLGLYEDAKGNGSLTQIYQFDNGTIYGGCTTWGYLATPYTINNHYNSYFLEIYLGDSFITTFSAARIYYQLQVGPAPGVATFTDVPTSHPFFQYIEALAASGITTGYDDDTFRPSEPITRGQMAVFLSRALGLVWFY